MTSTTSSHALISVVLPTINGSRFIRGALDSLLGQTYQNFELIVVDGGSTDGTLEILAQIDDSRVRVLHQGSNHDRLPGALNVGFADARGEYYTWAQDDDWYTPDALEAMAQALDAHPDVGLVYAGYHFVDEAGEFIREAQLGPPEGLYESNVVGQCFLYRRSVAEQVGPYDPSYVMCEDNHMWVRIYRRSRLLHLPGCFYFHRLHGGSLTGLTYGQYESERGTARARREVLGIGWWTYQHQLSETYIEEAFAAHAHRDLAQMRRSLIQGLCRNPTWLANRGVVSMAAQSIFGLKKGPA